MGRESENDSNQKDRETEEMKANKQREGK